MSNDENQDKSQAKPWWLYFIGLIIVLIVGYVLVVEISFQLRFRGMPIAAMTRGFSPDCIWTANTETWIDINQNGIREESEPPLPGIAFKVFGGSSQPSDWKGESTLFVWLPGCPRVTLEFSVEVPEEYYLTTKQNYSSDVRNHGQLYQFGFAYLPGVPTATPRPKPPECRSYKLGQVNVYDVTDVAVASDNTIWASTFNNGISHYLPQSDQWITYTTEDGLIGNQVYSISPFSDGSVWFATTKGISVWKEDQFLSFTTEDGLVNNEVFHVAPALDGTIWIGTIEGASHYIPSTNTWNTYTTENGLSENFVWRIFITPEGSVWFTSVTRGFSRLRHTSNTGEKALWDYYYRYDSEGIRVPFEDITSIQTAPDGKFWFGGSSGLMHYDPVSDQWEKYDLFQGIVNDIAISTDGTIWIASGKQKPIVYFIENSHNEDNILQFLDPRDGLPTTESRDDKAKGIAIDLDGSVWIATQDSVTKCVFPK